MLVDIAWISEHPFILCELNHLVNEWFQRLVLFEGLFAQSPKIMCLREWLIMPNEGND